MQQTQTMKIWLTIFLFICGCFLHSQVSDGSQIKEIGEVIIINESDISLSEIPEIKSISSKLTIKEKKPRKLKKGKTQTSTELYSKHSRKSGSERLISQKLEYKNLENNTFFNNSSGLALSAVLFPNDHHQLKKEIFFWKNCEVFSQNLNIRKITYYHLFFKDTGKLYQFFNKPPPDFFSYIKIA